MEVKSVKSFEPVDPTNFSNLQDYLFSIFKGKQKSEQIKIEMKESIKYYFMIKVEELYPAQADVIADEIMKLVRAL